MKHDFKVGDKVKINRGQNAFLSMIPPMEAYVGQTAHVAEAYLNHIYLDIDGSYWAWHPDCLSKISNWDKICI